MRSELLLATFEPDSTPGKRDVGNASAGAILCEQAYLGRASCCYQLDVLKACGLSDLVVETGDRGSGSDLSDVNDNVSNLTVEIGRIDVVPRR